MSCKDKFIPILVIFYMLAFLGYLVVSVFVVPANVDCANMGNIPTDAAVDLSMDDWIFSNMIAGVVIFSILTSFVKGKNSDGTCIDDFLYHHLYTLLPLRDCVGYHRHHSLLTDISRCLCLL